MNATIYGRLMDSALEHPLKETRELVNGFLAPPRDALLVELEQQLRHAYVAGVRDGFVQGVAADEEKL